MLSTDVAILDEDPDGLSTLEALDDISDIVESVVLSQTDAPERDAYMAFAEEFDEFADTVELEPELRTPEQNARLVELQERQTAAFEALLAKCPEHIRKLHEALRAAIEAEEALED